MGRGDDDEDNYAPPHLELEEAAALYDLELAILFAFERKEAVVTAVVYTKLTFAVFARGYLLVLVHWCRYRQRCGGLGGVEIIPGRKMLRGGRRKASEEEEK